MDEKTSFIKRNDSLPDGDVYRISLNTERDRKNPNAPSLGCFSLSDNDKKDGFKLSVDWSKKTIPEKSIARVGAQYHMVKQEYKNYTNREIYALDVIFLKQVEGIEDVIYSPTIIKKKTIGKISNPAHSSIVYSPTNFDENAPAIYTILKTQLKDLATNNRVPFDMDKVHELVKKYREAQK